MNDFFGYFWGALFLFGWFYLTWEMVRAAIKGRFWFWRKKANGKTWPPIRSETPIRFWAVWTLMAAPFLLVSVFAIAGFIGLIGKLQY